MILDFGLVPRVLNRQSKIAPRVAHFAPRKSKIESRFVEAGARFVAELKCRFAACQWGGVDGWPSPGCTGDAAER
jgi:hypothetical protein